MTAVFPMFLVRTTLHQLSFFVAVADAVTQTWYQASLLWHGYFMRMEVLKQEGLRSVNELAPDNAVSFDVQFGTMKFTKEEATTFAVFDVDVAIRDCSATPAHETQVRMEVKFAVKPEADTVLGIVGTAHRQMIDRLRAVADIIDAKTTDSLLFGSEA